jgi:hypothetical protein
VNIIISEGVYAEPVWEILGKNVTIEGQGKFLSIIKAVVPNYYTFICCESGIL